MECLDMAAYKEYIKSRLTYVPYAIALQSVNTCCSPERMLCESFAQIAMPQRPGEKYKHPY